MVLERSVVLPDGTTPVRPTVAADARLVGEPAAAFARTLALLAVLGLALLAAAVVQVEVGLRPPARLRRELAVVRGGLRRRFATTAVPIEVEPLTQDLNLLLEHSEAVLARARVQAGNLAHALKADFTVLANEVREPAPANVAKAPRLEAARADAPPPRSPHGAGTGRGRLGACRV